jgi:TonB family protein
MGSLAAAFVVHAAIFLGFALGTSSGGSPVVLPPVTIDLQSSAGTGMDSFAASAGSPGAPSGTEAAAAPAAPASGQGSGSPAFVIPTPRGQPADAALPAASDGASFRTGGAQTGISQEVSPVTGSTTGPVVPPSSSGAGTSSVQRSGTGVAAAGSSGTAAGGSLDLSGLDKSLSGGAAGKGSGTGAGTASGGSSSGEGSIAGEGGNGGQGYSVIWGGGGSGAGRRLLSTSSPKVPAWVSSQGLTLSVTVGFTLLSDGVIGGVNVQQSSGYADLDASVVEAIRRWRFTPSAGAAPARGLIPYVIRAR